MADIVIVKNLTKKYKEFLAVDTISFSVQPGEIVAFLGPNGAGKTTTIKMLTTLLEPTQGKVLINGHDLHHKDAVRRSFGIVFQDPSLDDELTAEENLMFHAVIYHVPRHERKKRIADMLKFSGLFERKNDLVKRFSGGMKRRLEIARSLIHHPKILFLDEPTSGLDPQTRNQMWLYVKEVNKKEGMTIFFTTHYMEEAQKHAQRIIIIDHGKIIRQGRPAAIMKETRTKSIEAAFLRLTGRNIREEEAQSIDAMRLHRRMWRG